MPKTTKTRGKRKQESKPGKKAVKKKAVKKKAAKKQAMKKKPAKERATTAVKRIPVKSKQVKAGQQEKGRARKREKTTDVGSPEVVRLPTEIGIIPLRDTVIFPYMIAPLVIGRPKSLHIVDEAANTDRMVGLATQVRPDIEEPSPSDLHGVGTAATILKMLKFPDGSTRVLVQGTSRVRIKRYIQREPYMKAEIEPVPEAQDTSVETQALLRSVSDIFGKIVGLSAHLPDELHIAVMNIENASRAADLIASNINLSTLEKQEILEAYETKVRLQKLIGYLNRELQVLELGSKIQSQVKTELDKSQREYYLREQLKAIRRELGEVDERTMEIEELKQKSESANMPKDARQAAARELDRLGKMPPQAAEYTVSRTYLD